MVNEVVEALREEGYEVSEVVNRKNGVLKEGISVKKPGDVLGVVVYELPYADMAANVAFVSNAYDNRPAFDTSKLLDKDYVLKNCYISVHDANFVDDDVVNEEYCDLRFAVRVSVDSGTGGETGSYLLKKGAASMAGVENEVMQIAKENTALSARIVQFTVDPPKYI